MTDMAGIPLITEQLQLRIAETSFFPLRAKSPIIFAPLTTVHFRIGNAHFMHVTFSKKQVTKCQIHPSDVKP